MPATEEQTTVIAPFGIEADHPRNDNLLIQCVPGCILRSAINGSKTVKNAKTGEESVPLDQSMNLGSFPKTPGMHLTVNPEELTVTISDPLYDDEELCERIHKWIDRTSPYNPSDKIKGMETRTEKLDAHRMKTLCREMLWLVEADEAKKLKGPFPDLDLIEGLPGKFLLNPGSRVRNSQPQFEVDWDQWVSRLNASGG